MAGQKIRTRILPVLAMPKSDILIYLLAALLGLGAGILEVTVGDLLATALFVLISTLVLGFVRPRRPWRWIVIVGIFVPLVRLAVYVVLSQKPYRAQIWESGLGFVTGTAGSYCGALARKGVDELFRSH
jgi:lysylphosphatidylglycerol synthetase-like protein (DUF2156 family)